MNYNEIDIRLTRKHKKVIARKSWFSLIMDGLIFIMLSLFYPVASLMYVYGKFDRGETVSQGALINLTVSTLLASLLIYAWLNSTKMRKIEGLEIIKNREVIDSLIEKHNWEKRRKTKTLIVASPPFELSALNWGRQFNFLLEKNHIYINVISFGRFQISPFHWFADRYKERIIIREIKEALRNVILKNV